MDLDNELTEEILGSYLSEILGDEWQHDSIVPIDDNLDIEDFDIRAGQCDLDKTFELMDINSILSESNLSNNFLRNDNVLKHLSNASVTGGGDKITRHTIPMKEYEYEPLGSIDSQITTRNMMALVFAEIKRKKIAGHHLDSMNSFLETGIKQIVTKLYNVDGRLRNLRDKTDEDKEISDIIFNVTFPDINPTPPTTVRYQSGTTQALTPGMARTKNLTLSAPMFLDATITATAVYKNGTTQVRTDEIKNHRIAPMLIPTGCKLCPTYEQSRETLKELEEDPNTTGGAFIIKGLEWTIDNLENITQNTFHVFKNAHLNEIARGTFQSKPGDAFENSYQIILRYLNNGSITIEFRGDRIEKFEIPFYLIFRALGITRDREIVDNIVYGVDNEDQVTVQLKAILQAAFDAHDSKFADIKNNTNQVEIISFISAKLNEDANTALAKKDINIAKYLNNSFLNVVDRHILPHIGTTENVRIKKLRFLGHLINKLLCVYMGIVEPSDRDSYKYKRIHAAGHSIAKSFKTDFNYTVVMEIKKRLIKDFKSTPFSQIQLAESVKAAINNDGLEQLLVQSLTTGNKTLTIKRNEITNRIASGTLYHKNDMNVKSSLCSINTPNSKSASKQNDRADEMRRVHSTYVGFICPSQSADTGEKVGTNKQMACTVSVCGSSVSHNLKRILIEDSDIILLDDLVPSQITELKLSKVFVNGDWIGCCKESHILTAKYRNIRRHDDIHYLTSIVWEPLVREVYFWTDVGRLMRPLVIVYNNLREYVASYMDKSVTKKVKFTQWIRLTKEHIRGLCNGDVTMEKLRAERVIEYISPEEQENAYLAQNINVLRKYQNDIRRKFTHCDIDQAIFGIVTLAGSMANHSNAIRNTMYTNHRKQSAGWPYTNFPFRVDKNITLQHYCERPVVTAFSDMLTNPNGNNCMVALCIHGGENMEDSITVNMSSRDCGMFNASFYNTEKCDLEKNEQFGNPDFAQTMDIKNGANYDYARATGYAPEGTVIKRGDVLIIKVAKIQKPTDNYLYIDKSVVYNHDEVVVVEKVIITRDSDDALIMKIKLRSDRPIIVGDKLSSRSGNKGIVANLVPRCDMPYSTDGLIPDLLVNAHSIPTRMAVNQVIECMLAQMAAMMGVHIDATAFIDLDIMGVFKKLETDFGVKYGGHRRLYDGKIGLWLDTLIFMGPTTYQRMLKYVIDEHYAVRKGPTSVLNHQPLDGKTNEGGLKIGEMEKDVICSHGTMRTLHNKFYDDSDGISVPVCRCNSRAVVNEREGIYKCKNCGDDADIVNTSSAWMANVFFDESRAMNANMEFIIAPHAYRRT